MRGANPTLTYTGGTKNGKAVSGCSEDSRCTKNDITEQLEVDTDMTGAKGWRHKQDTRGKWSE